MRSVKGFDLRGLLLPLAVGFELLPASLLTSGEVGDSPLGGLLAREADADEFSDGESMEQGAVRDERDQGRDLHLLFSPGWNSTFDRHNNRKDTLPQFTGFWSSDRRQAILISPSIH